MSAKDKHPKTAATTTGPPRSHGPSASLDVLVIEDNPVNRKLARNVLRHPAVIGAGLLAFVLIGRTRAVRLLGQAVLLAGGMRVGISRCIPGSNRGLCRARAEPC